MNKGYLIPEEKLKTFMDGCAMNNQYGIVLYATPDPQKARELLPQPLELHDASNPLAYAYIVNIRDPTFAPWYMEGGIGILARYGRHVGIYFLGLMLSGPGAMMGAFIGRETAGLPKKLCERIVVQRSGDEGHCFIERNGVRLLDVRVAIGAYNDPSFRQQPEGCSPDKPVITGGGCMQHMLQMGSSELVNLKMLYYSSPSRYYSWEPATADCKLVSSPDDRWGELPIKKILGAGWMVSDNWVDGLTPIYDYPKEQIPSAMSLLLPGRYDRCTFEHPHQWYE
ncbi:acetoacetate decarboxylase [Desulfonatronum zhilinae]|nr:acetoacetate decarboxylase [Desulfonatronum zhilinae]